MAWSDKVHALKPLKRNCYSVTVTELQAACIEAIQVQTRDEEMRR